MRRHLLGTPALGSNISPDYSENGDGKEVINGSGFWSEHLDVLFLGGGGQFVCVCAYVFVPKQNLREPFAVMRLADFNSQTEKSF